MNDKNNGSLSAKANKKQRLGHRGGAGKSDIHQVNIISVRGGEKVTSVHTVRIPKSFV